MRRRRTEAPDVEVAATRLERLEREERGGGAARVRGERSTAVVGGVAVTKQQEIDLGLRIAVLLDFDERLPCGRRSIDERIGRIDVVSPDLLVCALGSRFFRTIVAFAESAGKRSESLNVRRTCLTSAVVTHSPNAGS